MARKNKYTIYLMLFTVILSLLVFLTRNTPFIQESFQTANSVTVLPGKYCDSSGVCRYAQVENGTSIVIYEVTGNGKCESGFSLNINNDICVSSTCEPGFTMAAGMCKQVIGGNTVTEKLPATAPPTCATGERFDTATKKCIKQVGKAPECVLDIFKKIDETEKTGSHDFSSFIHPVMKCYANSKPELKQKYGTDYNALFGYFLAEGLGKGDDPCCKDSGMSGWPMYVGLGAVGVVAAVGAVIYFRKPKTGSNLPANS